MAHNVSNIYKQNHKNMEINEVISILNRAKTNSERLASVLLVTKLVRSNELSVADRQLAFEAIGFKFLMRLLRTAKTKSCNITTMAIFLDI